MNSQSYFVVSRSCAKKILEKGVPDNAIAIPYLQACVDHGGYVGFADEPTTRLNTNELELQVLSLLEEVGQEELTDQFYAHEYDHYSFEYESQGKASEVKAKWNFLTELLEKEENGLAPEEVEEIRKSDDYTELTYIYYVYQALSEARAYIASVSGRSVSLKDEPLKRGFIPETVSGLNLFKYKEGEYRSRLDVVASFVQNRELQEKFDFHHLGYLISFGLVNVSESDLELTVPVIKLSEQTYRIFEDILFDPEKIKKYATMEKYHTLTEKMRNYLEVSDELVDKIFNNDILRNKASSELQRIQKTPWK